MTIPSQRRIGAEIPDAGTEDHDRTPLAAGHRLAAVDGLRAVAALWVVLFHMHAFSGVRLWPGFELLARSGSTGVSLFLVLSGFCLYLPVTAGRHRRFRTGAFLRRRCWRLLPAYYASLLLVLIAHLLTDGRAGLPRLSGADLAAQAATHLTLTHQFFPQTFYGLNGAYWSLGLEWELYLTLPLLVLGVRRFGLARTFVAVCVVSAAYRTGLFLAVELDLLRSDGPLAQVVLPNLFLGRWAEFGLGMVTAELHARGRLPRIDWRSGAAVLLAAAAALLLPEHPYKHMLIGFVFAGVLCAVLAGGNPVARACSWPPLVGLGVMSYSLYLVHQPLVEVLAVLLSDRAPFEIFLGMLLSLPAFLLVGWVLFVSVERRSMGAAGRGRLSARRLLPVRSTAMPAPTRSTRETPDAATMLGPHP